MANYPKFPMRKPATANELHTDVRRWADELARELDSEDTKQTTRPSTNIYTVVTVTEIGRPKQGDVAYAISAAKFRGYTTTAGGWVDFH